ncbi:site-specific integrase [Acinetobacter pseudolwoffii]|uniref:tyrosine-type recombinase/integrase n=1 Tax=Acinetobacter pseudolwoffii TaxID=2053287 RepID=UPI001CE1B917|nr:site-specific integrase [Acinetobacter pseudolwoffii]UBX51530.1 site-specific integrase [Acinetobacter pseudolwoffii]
MKIPKPRKRGEAYYIEIMIDGKRSSATRDTARECEQWAAQKLLEAKANKLAEDNGIKQHYPFKTLFYKYYEEVGKKLRGSIYVKEQLKPFEEKFGALAEMSIHDITPKHLTTWRNKRATEVGANTLLREMALYSSVFSYAVKELFLLDVNPWTNVKKLVKPKARHRRIRDNEIQLILESLNYSEGQIPTLPEHYVAWAFLFALETAMRRGEILGIQMTDIFDRHVHLPKTKNGDSRNVPLTKKALALLDLIDHDGSKLIPQSENAFRLMWERRKAKVGLEDIHFHDARHEAITRFVNNQKLPVEVLAKVTGHKNIKMLVNTYYNPDVNDIADMLDA